MAPYHVAGKYAVATGGGSGITLAFVKLLLSKGCSVIVGDLQLQPAAEQLAAEYPHPSIDSSKPSFVFHKTDVRSWPQLSQLWKKALSTFPRVDLVVPGAGVFEPPASSFWNPPGVDGSPSEDSTECDPGVYSTIGTNLLHPIRLSQLAIGYWTTNKMEACLIFIGSIAGYTATAGTPFYYSSKAGLHAFVRSLNSLRKRLGIRVSCIAPHHIRTPLWEQPYCKIMLSPDEPMLEPEVIAEKMLELCENEEYGDGNILEVMPLGTIEEPRTSIRQVPYELLLPEAVTGLRGVFAEEEKLWQRLQTEGMQT
ncbi:NAD(P)-binding protein [Hypoxylon cercidicola]|nr:NAD(P)-binding protein [Hypoxylon cercidicola]